MSQSIDVLIIEPLDSDAKKTVAAIHRKSPQASTLRVLGGEQAERLIFAQGLFTEAPQVPRLIIVDLAAAGVAAKNLLRRLRAQPQTQSIPIAIFSASRNPGDLLESHLLDVQMSIVKPDDPIEYASAVERIMATWFENGVARGNLD
jgi:CheY-like chemotaxis protein